MDPVNKWLMTFIILMMTIIFMVGYKAGAGRYEMLVLSAGADSSVVYVLDTKEGEVQAKLVENEDLSSEDSRYRKPKEVFEYQSKPSYSYRKY